MFPLILILLTGCGMDAATTVTKPDDSPEQLVGFDFVSWPTATAEPIPVDFKAPEFCRAPITPGSDQAKAHGPHFKPAIVVRVNPEAIDPFKSHKSVPVGSTVVKEKHPSLDGKGPPQEYAAMIRREAGYDPAHGDWEYLYVVQGKPHVITRGKLGSCIDCHEGKKDQDYLFRTYLPAAPPPANGIK
jgi:hypothetical protein